MTVKDYIVHRVVSLEKAANLKIGDIIPIPREQDDFDCAESKRIVEHVFEEIRKASFSSLPSRKSCLFVLPKDKEIVRLWIESHNPHDDLDYALLTLQLSGDLIWCDEDKFTAGGIMCRNSADLAQEYWRSASEKYDSFDLPEGLFIGRAEVIRIELCHHIAPYPVNTI